MRMETMRQQKRQEREYRAALLETYGADGAEAILKAQSVVK